MTSSDLRLETERLVLRSWQNGDREPFARLNADPVVMEHFPGVLSRAESDSFAARIDAHFKDHGYGLWAVEVPGEANFIGFVGLSVPSFDAPFMPAVEVGWRIDKAYWGRGFATEAGHAAVADGFERVGLAEIVSFTTPANIRSIRVMERLGMTHNSVDDFKQPRLLEHHRLRHHVLYRLSQATWFKAHQPAPAG
ncbi:MAG: GNAT family N-acetyltransferase [Chloroflexi bacterium]|nr:MAG: GNAT family N-acetyltransferase [Chloroflexota bacterium]